MATVIDVSKRLGEYMLKGWVLTDRICTKCAKVPLMRSPPSAPVETHLCVNCDPGPSSANPATPVLVQTSPPAPIPQPSNDGHSVSSTSNSSWYSGASTPPTELSHLPDSPPLVPIMDTAELLLRRQQSDTASAEIGKRMLKGWAMLADECPNSNCYGIPLVRPPKAGPTINPRKECVICGIVYVDEKDAFGQDRLVPMQPFASPADTHRASHSSEPAVSSSSTLSAYDKGKGRTVAGSSSAKASMVRQPDNITAISTTPSSTATALETSARSLELTLIALSERLNGQTSAAILDPTPISQTAEAISKVAQALNQVKHLLWSENEALLR